MTDHAGESDALARAIVADIIDNLVGRKGLRQVWEGADEDVQAEIIDEWTVIAAGHLSTIAARAALPAERQSDGGGV